MSAIADLRTNRARLRISGSDRVAFLQGQCTNDIVRLKPSENCYAAFLNAKGKMRGDAYIVCQPESFLLDASEGLHPSLEKFIITEDVVIEDISPALSAWLVIGSLPALPSDAVTFAHLLGTGVLTKETLPASLTAAELEVLRIEIGIPAWGVDMDGTTIPVEAGLAAHAISYEKGCYIGQETIARIKTYGHVNRHLVQLAGPSLPARGEKLFAGEKEAGFITSAALSLRLGKTLALGYVRRELARPGTVLIAGGQSWEITKLCGE